MPATESLSTPDAPSSSSLSPRFFLNDVDTTSSVVAAHGPSVAAWLRGVPPGPYTTARVSVDGPILRAFRWRSQCARLTDGVARLFPDRVGVDDDDDLENAVASERRLRAVVTRACRAFLEERTSSSSSASAVRATLRVTLAASWNESTRRTDLRCAVEPMPDRRRRRHSRDSSAESDSEVEVVVRRDVVVRDHDPDVKDSRFVTDRRVLEACKGRAEDTLMAVANRQHQSGNDDVHDVDASRASVRLPPVWRDTFLLEGTSSNFFALLRRDDGRHVVRTAPLDRVLAGTVRESLFEALKHMDEEKVEWDDSSPPSLDSIDQWVGCFLTSTSRSVLPISRLVLPDHPSSVRTVERPRPLTTRHVGDNDDEDERDGSYVVFDVRHPTMRAIVRAVDARILEESEEL